MKVVKVSIDEEKLKAEVKARIRAAINQGMSGWTHRNFSGTTSPAQWWVDKPAYQNPQVRHAMSTDINATMSGDTIHIHLTYEVVDISASAQATDIDIE